MVGQQGAIQPTNPATGEAMEPVEATSAEGVVAAVEAARVAQREWAARPFAERAEAVRGLTRALGVEGVAEELARTASAEMGKPIRYARAEVNTVATRVGGFVERAGEACEDEVAREGKIEVRVQWRPLGVAAVIAPWNYPISTPNNLVLSALLTGNAVVLKPSELTPKTGALYHRALTSELPEGLVGLVQGDGRVGAQLCAAPVQMIAFTGSIGTGQAIMREAAGGMKRLVLELGGKDPMVVLPGADLELAAKHAAANSLRNTGQVCVAVERVFVPKADEERFASLVAAEVAALRVGDPADDETDVGPMASEQQRALVVEQLEAARRAGATFVVEGQPRGPGFFLGPSVLTGVRDDMAVATDETFGPVVAISAYESVDDAVARANATRYGLGASVWGPREDAEAVANRLEAGMIGVNRGLSAAAGAPWVGWKMSGFGFSRSVAGMRQFMQPRTLSRNA